LVKAVLTGESFAQHAIKQEVDRDLFDRLAAVLDDGKRAPDKKFSMISMSFASSRNWMEPTLLR
jgi:hypothetical protein